VRVSGSNNMVTIYTPKSTPKNGPSFAQEKVHAEINSPNPKIDIYKQITQKYDIRNASHIELREIAKKLYEQGEISLLEHGMLTFELKLPAEVVKNNPYNYFLTKTDRSGKRDWIAEFEARVQQNKKIGNLQGSILNRKIVDILALLQRK